MFYRVKADLLFTVEDEANDFYHDAQLALAKSSVINPGQEDEERGVIQLHRCYHDDPLHPECELISQEQAPCPP